MTDPPALSLVEVVGLVLGGLGVLILGAVVHELGHALAGHLVGFRVRLVLVGPLAATSTPTGWRLRVQRQLGRRAGVLADPVRPEQLRIRHVAFVAGGPVVHLIMAGAVVGAAAVWRGAWVPAAVLLTITAGWNVVPLGLRRNGQWLDGDWLLAWSLRPRLAMQRVALSVLYRAIEAGQRPREWDEVWARLVTLDERRRACSQEVAGDLLGYTWALDRGKVDEAGRLLSRAFAGRRLLPADQCAAVLVAAAYFVACHRRRRSLAVRLLEAAPPPSIAMGAADVELARAAIQLSVGARAEAVAACDRALAILDGIDDMPSGLVAFDRDEACALRDAALAGDSRRQLPSTPNKPGQRSQ
jgi:hypothetical protein